MPEALAIIPALFAGGGEALGGALGGLGSLFGIGEAAAAPAEAAALTLPAIDVAGGAGAGLAGADAAAIGASAAGGIPNIVIPAAAGAGFGAGDAAAGLGLAGLGADLALSPNSVMGGEFGPFGAGDGTTPVASAPTSTNPLSFAPSSPTPGGGLGAAGLAPPSSVGGGADFASIGPGGVPDATAGTPLSLAPPGASPGGGGVSDIISKLGSGALNQVEKNPLSLALAAPLLKQLISPTKLPQQDQLQALQGQEAAFTAQQNKLGTELTDPLISGHLPSGAQQAVDNAVNDAITSTKAKYANLGLSGSTAETDAIANIQNQRSAIQFQIAEQMAQTGLNATSQAASTFGLQDQVFSQLMQGQLSNDQALSSSLARFAAAASTTPQAGLNVRLG